MGGINKVYEIGKNFRNHDYLQKVKFLLNHRGPDTFGIWNNVDLNISFVHTRLSILDLSENGSQPMFSMSKQFVCCYNGEIYNHEYLRKCAMTALGSKVIS